MEALASCGLDGRHPAIQRGIRYLERTQEQDGSWYGRWGVDYIYGTFLALRGVRAAGVSPREAFVLRAGEWLRSIQNADGGWGESCASYDRACFVPAPSTARRPPGPCWDCWPAATPSAPVCRKALSTWVETQRADGAWNEDLATGTGFPRVSISPTTPTATCFRCWRWRRFFKSRDEGERG